jgi:organic hydroperoxide reductase OsmC/OhrA
VRNFVDVHLYETRIEWSGSTGLGWEHYERSHSGTAPPATQELRLTTGEAKGDPALLNPEQLVVMAASSCQMLWFLHLAAKARIDVVEYVDEAHASMPADEALDAIVLRPRIVLGSEQGAGRVERLCATAHEHCNVARSLRTPIEVEPRVEVRA